jgi:triacylglycerol lipase
MRIISLFADVYYFFRLLYLMVRHKNPPKSFGNPKNRTEIVVIPGVYNTWAALIKLIEFLSKSHKVHVVPQLKRNSEDIKSSAEIVRNLIDEKKLDKVVLVGHSKGGLIGKYLLTHLNSDDKVIGLVSIATPYSGTSIANYYKRWSMFSPRSKMINELSDEAKVNKKIIAIYSSTDPFIWHKNKGFLKGALDNIEIKNHGHQQVLFSKKIFEEVSKSIKRLEA